METKTLQDEGVGANERKPAEQEVVPPSKLKQLGKIIVAGTGFVCDAYDLFVINLVIVIMKTQYVNSIGGASSISTAALVGALIGQLLFGILADRIGRKIGFVVTLSLVTLGALLSALSFQISPTITIYLVLSVFRFILGIGIGGEYPLSATITSESSHDDSRRGQNIALVFSMQGLGILMAPLFVLLLLAILGPGRLDLVWRLALGAGAIPGLIMLYFRIRLQETDQFTKAKELRKQGMKTNWKQLIKKYWKALIGTAGTWFIFDITFYANGLFNATLLELIGFGRQGSDTEYDVLLRACYFSVVLAVIGLPGYFVGTILIERMGRKPLQLWGFAMLAILYIAIGVFYDTLIQVPAIFLILYGATFFFSNAGPNTVTFVLPSEVFPTEVRASCHGISAAAGKLGAALGGALIQPLFLWQGFTVTLIVCGIIAGFGFLVTLLFVHETKGKPLEEDQGPDAVELEQTSPTTALLAATNEEEEIPLERPVKE